MLGRRGSRRKRFILSDTMEGYSHSGQEGHGYRWPCSDRHMSYGLHYNSPGVLNKVKTIKITVVTSNQKCSQGKLTQTIISKGCAKFREHVSW